MVRYGKSMVRCDVSMVLYAASMVLVRCVNGTIRYDMVCPTVSHTVVGQPRTHCGTGQTICHSLYSYKSRR